MRSEDRWQKFGAQEFAQNGAYLRFTFEENGDLKPFLSSIESVAPDVEVVSVGRSLEIVKQVGSPSRLEQSFLAYRDSMADMASVTLVFPPNRWWT